MSNIHIDLADGKIIAILDPLDNVGRWEIINLEMEKFQLIINLYISWKIAGI